MGLMTVDCETVGEKYLAYNGCFIIAPVPAAIG